MTLEPSSSAPDSIWQPLATKLVVNVSGARAAGKKSFALRIARKACEHGQIKKPVIVFSGNVRRWIARKVIEQLFPAERERLASFGLSPDDEEKLTQLIIKEAEYVQNHPDALAEYGWIRITDTTEFNEATSLLAPQIESFVQMMKTYPAWSSYLRRAVSSVRRKAFEEADLVITTYPGHASLATVNFFLAVPSKYRAQKFQQQNWPDGVKNGAPMEDENDRRRVEHHLPSLDEDRDRDRMSDVDPAGRLFRYPGHFIPLKCGLLEEEWTGATEAALEHIETARRLQQLRSSAEDRLMKTLDKDRRLNQGQGRLSILMFKGGAVEALYAQINSVVLLRLAHSHFFDICLGTPHLPSLRTVLERWDFVTKEAKVAIEAYAEPHFAPEVLHDIAYGAGNLDHWRVKKWMEVLMSEIPTLRPVARRAAARITTFLSYVTSESQYIMLKRRTDRRTILDQWGIKADAALKDAERRLKKDSCISAEESLDWHSLDEQEFTKLLLVGRPGISKPLEGTLRAIIRDTLLNMSIETYMPGMAGQLSINEIAEITNGIHGPNTIRGEEPELQREIAILPWEDLQRFTTFAHLSNSSRRNLE